jgi:hypothetical protein
LPFNFFFSNNKLLCRKQLFDYLVPVAETVLVIPAEAGIQLFRSGPLLSQG